MTTPTDTPRAGTAYRWTDSGDLVCTDHRTGRAAVVVASKGGTL